METLEHIDRALLIFVNSHHTPAIDELMHHISGIVLWLPLYFFIGYLVWKIHGWRGLGLYVAGVIVCIAMADLISFRLIKNTVCRYRPSHNLEIQNILHYYIQADGIPYKGGQYGFVSSHAANFFALSFWTFFFLRRHYKWVVWLTFASTLLICYSRMYLGVHYPSDLLAGGLLGTLIAYLLWTFMQRFQMLRLYKP